MDSLQVIQRTPVIIKNDDRLTIQVTSRSMNQEQTAMFNIIGANSVSQNYIVNSNGNIDIPLIGEVKAAGYNREQFQQSLKERLSAYIKDPAVTVRFADFRVNILGEVKAPGSHNFDNERVTIIDAISAAGDLTDYGRRNDVIVIREDNIERKMYTVDLRSGLLFQSPAFLLQPNDIVYVNATQKKIRLLNANPNNQKNWQLFFGLVSVLTTITTLLITVKNN